MINCYLYIKVAVKPQWYTLISLNIEPKQFLAPYFGNRQRHRAETFSFGLLEKLFRIIWKNLWLFWNIIIYCFIFPHGKLSSAFLWMDHVCLQNLIIHGYMSGQTNRWISLFWVGSSQKVAIYTCVLYGHIVAKMTIFTMNDIWSMVLFTIGPNHVAQHPTDWVLTLEYHWALPESSVCSYNSIHT